MIIESRDVFFEDIFPFKRATEKTSGRRTHEVAFKDESTKEPIVNAKIEPRRSQRSRISKYFGPDFIAYAIESKPQTFKEAIQSQKHKFGKKL